MLLKVVETSITVGIMIGILTLLFPILNKKFSAKWRYWIWLLLSIPLILPFNISFSKPLVILTAPAYVQNSLSNIDDLKAKINISTDTEEDFNSLWKKPISQNNVLSERELNIPYIIWITVAIFLLLYRFIGYFIFRKNLLRWGISSESPSLEKTLQELKEEMIIKPNIRLIISEKAPSPMVLGFSKPLLILPNNQYCKEDLKIILKHELIHIKRHDVWYKLLMTIAVSIHWFNPLVYLMESSASRDLEISCDEELVKGKNIEYRKLYSEAILRAIDFQKVYNCTFTTYWGGKKIMKQRFQNILNQNKKSKGFITASAILLTVAISGSLVACSSKDVNQNVSPSKQVDSSNVSNTASSSPKENDDATKITDYKTESDFLNSPEGATFQQVTYNSAKAYLSGNLKQISEDFIDPKAALQETKDVFKNIDYMKLKWNLQSIKSEDEVHASYEYRIKGEDSVSYITMELKRVDGNWKIQFIGEEK